MSHKNTPNKQSLHEKGINPPDLLSKQSAEQIQKFRRKP